MKFSGRVGFYEGDTETSPDVFINSIVERKYTGDVYRFTRRFQQDSSQNDTLVPNNQISIVSDLYARQNWSSIRYVIWNGAKLKVTNVDLANYPRLTLEVGGVYNGKDKVRVE